ncbi:MAG TPA: aminotransferase class V-fold PLP-dependent enzyme, partial [Chloroflexota bacterium]|nr:aminotransferase class V-fold PLP-dependent enzyme [Chloroflexota bacterium]
AGALSLDVASLGVDLMSLSAHKIYGPKGVGVLYVRRGVILHPVVFGGGQESGFRSGTENVPGCMGMAAALELAEAERTVTTARLTPLRDRLIAGVLDAWPQAHLTGHPTARLPGHASFYLDHRSSESVLVDLDARGILCSSGSACHAGHSEPSHVLLATGLDRGPARNGLRMTLGSSTADADIDVVLDAVREVAGERVGVAG